MKYCDRPGIRNAAAELPEIGSHGAGAGGLGPPARCSQEWQIEPQFVRYRASDLLVERDGVSLARWQDGERSGGSGRGVWCSSPTCHLARLTPSLPPSRLGPLQETDNGAALHGAIIASHVKEMGSVLLDGKMRSSPAASVPRLSQTNMPSGETDPDPFQRGSGP
jgi:hypothetical protein